MDWRWLCRLITLNPILYGAAHWWPYTVPSPCLAKAIPMSMSFSHWLVDENRGLWTFTPLTTGLFDDRWYTKPAQTYLDQKEIGFDHVLMMKVTIKNLQMCMIYVYDMYVLYPQPCPKMPKSGNESHYVRIWLSYFFFKPIETHWNLKTECFYMMIVFL